MDRRGGEADRRLRLGALLLLAAVAVLLLAAAWALGAPQVRYVWPLSMISDLGSGTCFSADGRWICSPRAGAFNAGLVLTGVLLAAAVAVLGRRGGPWLRAALLTLALGLLLLAVFPSDVAPRVHLAAAVLALPLSSAMLLVSGIREETVRGSWDGQSGPAGPAVPRLRAALAAVSLISTIAHLVPSWRIRGAAELISLLALVLIVLLESGVLERTARMVRRDAQPPR